MGLPQTASGFDQVQVHVDHLSGKVQAVPTRSTDTAAAEAAQIMLETRMALRSGDGVPDVLMVDSRNSALVNLGLLVGSAYHKNTNGKAERVNGVPVLGDTLRAFANHLA